VSFNVGLLQALAPGELVSGEALGEALGISRAAVWKAVQRLVALGLEVDALPGRGYRLAAPLELLDAARIRTALPAGGQGARIGLLEVLTFTDSTNARVLAEALPVGELVACLAEYQSAGRGRRGRRWLAPPGGGLCLSVCGRLPAAPVDYATLPTSVGVACAMVLERHGITGIRLKWPNDLLLGEAKLGGILIELRGEAQGPATVAVGLGLNLRLGAATRAAIAAAGGLPPAELCGAGSGPPPGRNALAAALVGAIADSLARAPAGLSDTLLEGWRRRDALQGLRVRVEGAGGERTGIARGVDRSGALLLELADGAQQRVTAGEVTLRSLG
jgi:BirA family transcriptional regulator, biotin operon repressor / biotin---[acetyl-CoA-carboxylase] ligase